MRNLLLLQKKPKMSNFCPQNSNFKPKWWNMKVQVYQKLLNQCTWKFDTMLRTWNRGSQMQYDDVTTNPIWRTAAILKIDFWIYLVIYCPINAKFCPKKQNHVQTSPKYKVFEIQDGGWPSFWKWFYRYISARNHPISMKLGVLTQILVPRTVTCWFIKIWYSKWRTAAILKIVHWLYLHELYCSTDAIFGVHK